MNSQKIEIKKIKEDIKKIRNSISDFPILFIDLMDLIKTEKKQELIKIQKEIIKSTKNQPNQPKTSSHKAI